MMLSGRSKVWSTKPPKIVNGQPVTSSESLSDLVSQLRPTGPKTWAAIVAIGKCNCIDALAVLLELFRDSDWRYRRCAIEAIALHPQGVSAAPTVVAALSDSSPYVVQTACDTVAKLHLSEAHDLVLHLLNSREPSTREAAISALSHIWQLSDFNHVLERFESDPEKDVRRAAGWALVNNQHVHTWRRLFDAWQSHPNACYRTWACYLIRDFGDANARSEIRSHLNDPDGHVRKAARRALEIDDVVPHVETRKRRDEA
jgi:hypothetical protein